MQDHSINQKKQKITEQFIASVGYKPNLDNPKTLNEKLQWLKLYEKSPLITLCADKYRVREYVRKKIGNEYLIPLLGVWDSPEQIDFEKLPNQFVLKVNWGSGQNLICKDKSQLNITEAKEKLHYWLKPESNHYWFSYEWCYKDIKPKIIAEKYIEQMDGDLLDYKLFVYNGKVKNLFVSNDRFVSLKTTYYDSQWNKLPFTRLYPNNPTIHEKPKLLMKLIELAEKLGKKFIHARIDFYILGDDIKFGEITFYQGAGLEKIFKFTQTILKKYSKKSPHNKTNFRSL